MPPARRDDSLTPQIATTAVSKVAAAGLIHYYGKKQGLPCVNLRLYSVYGPLEDSSRLIPNIIRYGLPGEYPEFVDPRISRDFVYRRRCLRSFHRHGAQPQEDRLRRVIQYRHRAQDDHRRYRHHCRRVCSTSTQEPAFTMPNGEWDVTDWYANVEQVAVRLGGRPASASRRDCSGPPTGIGRCPTKPLTFNPPRNLAWTRAQCQCDHRLLQGRPGHPDHVRAAQDDVYRAQRRLRDHLRQRLQPRRHRGGHPCVSPRNDRRVIGDLALAQLRLAVGVPQRHGDRDQERLRAAGRRPPGPARTDRAIRGQMARGLRRCLRPAGEARCKLAYANGIQALLPGI